MEDFLRCAPCRTCRAAKLHRGVRSQAQPGNEGLASEVGNRILPENGAAPALRPGRLLGAHHEGEDALRALAPKRMAQCHLAVKAVELLFLRGAFLFDCGLRGGEAGDGDSVG